MSKGGDHLKHKDVHTLKTADYKGDDPDAKTNIYNIFVRENDMFTSTTFNKYDNNTIISDNANGIMFRYIDVNNNKIAVKYAKYISSLEEEIDIINYIKNNKDDGKCSELLVPYILYKHIIIIENVNGTILDLKSAIASKKSILAEILYAIMVAVKCLWEIGLYWY